MSKERLAQSLERSTLNTGTNSCERGLTSPGGSESAEMIPKIETLQGRNRFVRFCPKAVKQTVTSYAVCIFILITEKVVTLTTVCVI